MINPHFVPSNQTTTKHSLSLVYELNGSWDEATHWHRLCTEILGDPTSRHIQHMKTLRNYVFSADSEKVAHTRLPSIGLRRWSHFLAVSLQVTWVINPAVGCHYFPPSLQLPPQPLRGLLPILLLGEDAKWVWTVCLRLSPDSVATAVWTRALLRLSPVR